MSMAMFNSKLLNYQRVSGWWYTHPSEKYESIGMMKFPIYEKYWKVIQSSMVPVTTDQISMISKSPVAFFIRSYLISIPNLRQREAPQAQKPRDVPFASVHPALLASHGCSFQTQPEKRTLKCVKNLFSTWDPQMMSKLVYNILELGQYHFWYTDYRSIVCNS